ncbi:MAG TPA: helix-turn-helix domain-containing protein [Patescibacteria group bacterium]|jgi:hypothetical protein
MSGDPGGPPEGPDRPEVLYEGPYSIEQCAAAACWVYDLSLSELRSASRMNSALSARSLAVCLARAQEEPPSYPQIGRYLYRHHSTIMNSEARGRAMLEDNREFRMRYEKARRGIQEGTVERGPTKPSEDRLQDLIKDAIWRGELTPIDVLDHEIARGMKIHELLVALPASDGEATMSAEERASLILLTAGILERRRVQDMSQVEKDALYHVLDELGFMPKSA